MSPKEYAITLIKYICICSVASYIFYDSYLGLLFMIPLFYFYMRWERERIKNRKRDELEGQFVKVLNSIETSLFAGVSLENSFILAMQEMEKMYGIKSPIYRELKTINTNVSAGQRLTDALYDFAKRSENQRIEDFALIFSVATQNGTSCEKVIENCVSLIESEKETEDEAKVIIRGKQYEQRIMSIIPIGIIIYLRFSSGSFMGVLYHRAFGVVVMSICLLIYISSILLSERICRVNF